MHSTAGFIPQGLAWITWPADSANNISRRNWTTNNVEMGENRLKPSHGNLPTYDGLPIYNDGAVS